MLILVLNITQLPILQTDSSKKKFISTDWYHPNMTSIQIDSVTGFPRSKDL